MNNIVWTYQME